MSKVDGAMNNKEENYRQALLTAEIIFGPDSAEAGSAFMN